MPCGVCERSFEKTKPLLLRWDEARMQYRTMIEIETDAATLLSDSHDEIYYCARSVNKLLAHSFCAAPASFLRQYCQKGMAPFGIDIE